MKRARPKRIDIDEEDFLELIRQTGSRLLTTKEREKLEAGVKTREGDVSVKAEAVYCGCGERVPDGRRKFGPN